jgi:hypothetical protein
VPGAVEDLRRTIELIYTEAERFKTLVISLDSHLTYQNLLPDLVDRRARRAPVAAHRHRLGPP